MAFILRRGAVYYFNLRLPKHLHHQRDTIRISLNLRSRREALFMASGIAQRVYVHLAANPLSAPDQLHRLCIQWRNEAWQFAPTEQSPHIALPMQTSTPLPLSTPSPTPPTPSLSALSQLYIKEGESSGAWREANTLDVKRAVRVFFELMDDMPVCAFDSEQARLLKHRLSRLPQYFSQRPEFTGMTLRQVVESKMAYPTITAVTVNNRLRKLTAFLNWCKSNGYVTQNPLAGVKVMTGAAKEARLSFTPADLETLLNLDTLRHEARKHPCRFWLPLLARFTGARLEELCQLHIDDLFTVENSLCIRIDDRREGQKLKNRSSRRIVPIHPILLELGIQAYVDSVRASGASQVFPELEAVREKYGYGPSKWFGRYRNKLGVSDPKKTFHSFRHTFVDDLREAGVQDSIIKQLLGHTDDSVTFGIYGSRTPIREMTRAIRKIPTTPLKK
ncbi:site-specific integrase [Pseudomonas sp. PDM19]|uniref:site-specific integrase n=1 Tax=Pseudomonas sp. PDM19 TaxID=2769272 RepID=UPI001780F97F|nr:site-specific integrase [Pseudomonas sp. PDM19]MBD9631412.1 site-specific integrase [Pseudomonas sp. PDM19]